MTFSIASYYRLGGRDDLARPLTDKVIEHYRAELAQLERDGHDDENAPRSSARWPGRTWSPAIQRAPSRWAPRRSRSIARVDVPARQSRRVLVEVRLGLRRGARVVISHPQANRVLLADGANTFTCASL